MLLPFDKTLCENWSKRCRRKSFVQEEKARRETRVAERFHGRLERVRLPHDELQPPTATCRDKLPATLEPIEGLVASYDFSVVAWEVQTTLHFAEKYSAYHPFDVQVIALQEDLRDPLRNSGKMFMAEDAGRVVPGHLQRSRGYLMEDPNGGSDPGRR